MAGITLTKRERQVLLLLTWPNKDIALMLGLKPKTVRNYVTRLGIKLLAYRESSKCTRIRLLLAALHSRYIRLNEISPGPIVVKVDYLV